jgi:hypothetical protein
MNIKIISDGTVRGTRVVDQETGAEVYSVTAIHWQFNTATGLTECTLELEQVPVEVQARLG